MLGVCVGCQNAVCTSSSVSSSALHCIHLTMLCVQTFSCFGPSLTCRQLVLVRWHLRYQQPLSATQHVDGYPHTHAPPQSWLVICLCVAVLFVGANCVFLGFVVTHTALLSMPSLLLLIVQQLLRIVVCWSWTVEGCFVASASNSLVACTFTRPVWCQHLQQNNSKLCSLYHSSLHILSRWQRQLL